MIRFFAKKRSNKKETTDIESILAVLEGLSLDIELDKPTNSKSKASLNKRLKDAFSIAQTEVKYNAKV
ncbi:hypothetical protein [Pseudoalteromonas sp. Z9A6]|uniref:hypothetical protein n=1 Tax=Pseudoalteromonas sp. Z9A6 TaxID=2686352 RepID=UPI0013FDD46B|nr:hypothetical protein [Pseudoalteromonas sp. Z9A6]